MKGQLAAISLGVLSVIAAPSAHAQSGREFAEMGQRAWLAFECATLADTAASRAFGENADSEVWRQTSRRLFALGYADGGAFLQAFERDRYQFTIDDLRSVPLEMWSTGGPIGFKEGVGPAEAEFVLGMVWERAQSQGSLSDVSEQELVIEARRRFRAAGCNELLLNYPIR